MWRQRLYWSCSQGNRPPPPSLSLSLSLSPSLKMPPPPYCYRIAGLCKDYCGILNEEAIRLNFVLIYELLDEVLVR